MAIPVPQPVRTLIDALRTLPGIGPRNATRLALHLTSPKGHARELALALTQVLEQVRPCKQCGFLAEAELCSICQDPHRDSSQLCVVEQVSDVIQFEQSGAFRGHYHILGGLLSPLDGIGPKELNLPKFFNRLRQQPIIEVILALPTDGKGETTTLYLARELKDQNFRVTRLATGISAGSGLEWVDSLTLEHALEGRRPV